MHQARIDWGRAGVGLPRGRGRLRRRDSLGVAPVPCPMEFSLRSEEDLPVLRLDQPSAVRLAADPTRGRALGTPNASSGLKGSSAPVSPVCLALGFLNTFALGVGTVFELIDFG